MIEENKTNETVDETPVEEQPAEQQPELNEEDLRATVIDEMEKASQKALDAMRRKRKRQK